MLYIYIYHYKLHNKLKFHQTSKQEHPLFKTNTKQMQHWIKIYKKGKTSDTQSARIHPFISFAVLLHSELSIPFCSFSLFSYQMFVKREALEKKRTHSLSLSKKRNYERISRTSIACSTNSTDQKEASF